MRKIEQGEGERKGGGGEKREGVYGITAGSLNHFRILKVYLDAVSLIRFPFFFASRT